MVSRDEHIKQCKEKALFFVEQGDLSQAYNILIEGLHGHPETCADPRICLGA